MHVSAHTQPGVQEQPPNTLWVAVFLILEDLTGCDLQLHLEKQKNRLHRKPADEKICFIISSFSDCIPASSTQAGLSCSTSPPCFSCAASAGAPMPAGHGGIECGFAEMCFYPRLFNIRLYLDAQRRRYWPAFVQNTFGKVFPKAFEEGATHMIQEVGILRTVLLMSVDEAFNQTKEAGWMEGHGGYRACKM